METWGCGCGKAVERTACNLEVVGLNPPGAGLFFLLSLLLIPSLYLFLLSFTSALFLISYGAALVQLGPALASDPSPGPRPVHAPHPTRIFQR